MAIETYFRQDLNEEISLNKNQVESISDQLTLLDVKIDKYDKVIENIDRKLINLIDEINVGINSVKTAYDNRISVGCKSNLVWVVVAQNVFLSNSGITSTITYQAQKNPAVEQNYNYYGIKYYRKPSNIDYGANIVTEINGTISSGSTIMAVSSIGGTFSLQINDTITDSIDNPYIFSSSNLPEIVGFGTTSVVGASSTVFQGAISIGSTVLVQTGIGTTTNISIGDVVTSDGILQPNTSVVGISTGQAQIIIYESGGYTTKNIIGPALILNKISIGSTTNQIFNVGILTTYPSLILSDSAQNQALNSSFTVIRNTPGEFDISNNPIDPVTISIMDTSSVGLGHLVKKVTDGVSNTGPYQWHEVREDPEPSLGAGAAKYYTGNQLWPTLNGSYASEGSTVTLDPTYSLSVIGYTSSKPPGAPSDCNPYDSAITLAEQQRDAIIAKNESTINQLVNKSKVLRRLRDKKELQAFSLHQAKIFAESELKKAKEDLIYFDTEDFSSYE